VSGRETGAGPDGQRGPSLPDDASAPFFTIGQVAEILELRPGALRRFEQQELVSPERSEGGQRRYSREEIERLREVRDLTDQGLTLLAVREVLALRQEVSRLEAELAELRQRQRFEQRAENAGRPGRARADLGG